MLFLGIILLQLPLSNLLGLYKIEAIATYAIASIYFVDKYFGFTIDKTKQMIT